MKYFSNKPVNTGRQPEIDMSKAFMILLMIMIHVFQGLAPETKGFLQTIMGYGAGFFGAGSFMIFMGIGMRFSRHQGSKDLVIRGIALLTVSQLKNLLDAYHEEVTRSGFLRNFLLDALSPTETDSQLGMLSLPSSDWCLFVIECDESFTGTYAYQTVENGFASGQNDLCCELDAQHLVLVKDAGSLDIPLFSRTLVDTLRSEAMIQTHVGYSSPVADFKQLASSYQEARIALSIRRTFYAEQDTASYNQLGLGRLIAELPAEPCRIYLKEMFADFVPDELTEEERNTIQIFYENNHHRKSYTSMYGAIESRYDAKKGFGSR